MREGSQGNLLAAKYDVGKEEEEEEEAEGTEGRNNLGLPTCLVAFHEQFQWHLKERLESAIDLV